MSTKSSVQEDVDREALLRRKMDLLYASGVFGTQDKPDTIPADLGDKPVGFSVDMENGSAVKYTVYSGDEVVAAGLIEPDPRICRRITYTVQGGSAVN